MEGVPPAGRRPLLLHAALLLATCATTLTVGARQVVGPAEAASPGTLLLAGLPYAAALIGILLAHELGHWLMARAWGVDASLPFFIPDPLTFGGAFLGADGGGAGTFGAVIRLRSRLPSRRAVLDIGAAGPIAGFLVALPLLAWGLASSEVRPLGDAFLARGHAGSPLAIARALLAGQPVLDGGPLLSMGDSLLTAGLQRLVLGPLPPHHDVLLHPVAFAAWIGLLVTTLNLLPVGQLDGGHVVYAWLGERAALRVSRAVSWALLAAGLCLSWSWLLWWAITRFVVRLPHPPADDEAPLDRPRVAIAVLSLVLFVLTFIPVPVGT